GEAFRNSVPAFADRALPGIDPVAQIPDLAQRGKERLSRFYERLDEVLAKTPYVAGESYSIADITALVAIDFAGWIKIQPAESLVNIAGWYGRVSSRPSASA
ncbi:MAG: glutathione binding-like protein, partial [Alphaproteobacteria bacterium]|nr:glutathione binding-like protein [Alphaproteobacteria bacterium]